jgi:DNA-directed RNA polymerase specialized sigma24 family protein
VAWVLHGTLSLHGINDVEAFVVAIVQRSRLELSHYDREDLVAHLVATAWQLSLGYDHGDPRYPPRFSVYVTPILRNRVVDWQRQRFGRTRWVFKDRVVERKLPQLVSFDDPEHDQLGAALGTWAGDPTADRSPDLLRVLGRRSGSRARDYEALGLRPPRRTPG